MIFGNFPRKSGIYVSVVTDWHGWENMWTVLFTESICLSKVHILKLLCNLRLWQVNNIWRTCPSSIVIGVTNLRQWDLVSKIISITSRVQQSQNLLQVCQEVSNFFNFPRLLKNINTTTTSCPTISRQNLIILNVI